jgi:hypothetical protein
MIQTNWSVNCTVFTVTDEDDFYAVMIMLSMMGAVAVSIIFQSKNYKMVCPGLKRAMPERET